MSISDGPFLPTGDTTLFSDVSAALEDVQAQLSRAEAAAGFESDSGSDGGDSDADDDDGGGTSSDASNSDPAQRAAFERLFRATVSALETSNSLLLSTLNSRSQLASLRAQQSAVERDMNARELELRRRIEANKNMTEWVRDSAEQLEDLVRDLDVERLMAAGGVAPAGGWGFSRPLHWRVPSIGALGAVFGASENETASSSADQSLTHDTPAPSPGSGIPFDDDGTMTIGKTAAKRLERVLIKHSRNQNSLAIPSSTQSRLAHSRNVSVASSSRVSVASSRISVPSPRLEAPSLSESTGDGHLDFSRDTAAVATLNRSTTDLHEPSTPSIYSPKLANSRRLSSQSNASKLSTSSFLRSPYLARLDSNTAPPSVAQASSELAAGWTADGNLSAGGWDFGPSIDSGAGRLKASPGGGRGALAALKKLNDQKGVLPGGPEVDGLAEASSGAGAWASLTSWVGLGGGGAGGSATANGNGSGGGDGGAKSDGAQAKVSTSTARAPLDGTKAKATAAT
ncbi:hypothetical protein OC834_000805 [Tilletia horrida]|uniref:Uncharacterized protein n=1 Tax=Tilletia horrida TaxID=155126 RepID=A0AAN6JNT7_9BASI|nr:hypothetical protein OC834_000805 [Tilletia horrida]KAK0541311.1 hypothetical protein OC842_000016 [Tilletia horrida]